MKIEVITGCESRIVNYCYCFCVKRKNDLDWFITAFTWFIYTQLVQNQSTVPAGWKFPFTPLSFEFFAYPTSNPLPVARSKRNIVPFLLFIQPLIQSHLISLTLYLPIHQQFEYFIILNKRLNDYLNPFCIRSFILLIPLVHLSKVC